MKGKRWAILYFLYFFSFLYSLKKPCFLDSSGPEWEAEADVMARAGMTHPLLSSPRTPSFVWHAPLPS